MACRWTPEGHVWPTGRSKNLNVEPEACDMAMWEQCGFIIVELNVHDPNASRRATRLDEISYVCQNDLYFSPLLDYVYWDISDSGELKRRRGGNVIDLFFYNYIHSNSAALHRKNCE